MRELKIEQAENGYVVNMMDFTGRKRVFKSFRLLVTFMRIYFEGKTEATVEEIAVFPGILGFVDEKDEDKKKRHKEKPK